MTKEEIMSMVQASINTIAHMVNVEPKEVLAVVQGMSTDEVVEKKLNSLPTSSATAVEFLKSLIPELTPPLVDGLEAIVRKRPFEADWPIYQALGCALQKTECAKLHERVRKASITSIDAIHKYGIASEKTAATIAAANKSTIGIVKEMRFTKPITLDGLITALAEALSPAPEEEVKTE